MAADRFNISAARVRCALYLPGAALLALALGACGGGGNSGNGNTTPAMPPPVNTISGFVSFEGKPLDGALIIAFNTNTNSVVSTTLSDANGAYTITGLETMWNVMPNYQLWASKAGYAFYPSVKSGANVIRQDYTGLYGTSVDGIYKTVINFDSKPDSIVSGATFSAYDGSNPRVSLAGTGQTQSFAPGDDAAQGRGAAAPVARLVDNGDGTVTDHTTGLVWLKNAGCLAQANWNAALAAVNALAAGACGLSDGSTAGAWRLPNVNELESIVDASAANPALPAGHPFTAVANAIYWSATSYFAGQAGSPNAWAIRLADGRYVNDSLANAKATASNAVWAVRGGSGGAVTLQATGEYVNFATGADGAVQSGVPLTYPRWLDNANGTVTDTVTGLVWLKQANCISATWTGALAAIAALASGQCGLSDGSAAGSWRMPNRREALSLADRAISNHADFFSNSFVNASLGSQPAIFGNFDSFQYYWTSTTDAADPTRAWTVFSCDFGIYDTPKSATGYTLAVR